jgi:hypothetical protein
VASRCSWTCSATSSPGTIPEPTAARVVFLFFWGGPLLQVCVCSVAILSFVGGKQSHSFVRWRQTKPCEAHARPCRYRSIRSFSSGVELNKPGALVALSAVTVSNHRFLPVKYKKYIFFCEQYMLFLQSLLCHGMGGCFSRPHDGRTFGQFYSLETEQELITVLRKQSNLSTWFSENRAGSS